MKRSSLLLLALLFSSTILYAQGTTKVACVGNSITQGPGRDNPDSYPLLMQEVLGDRFLVKNFGVSGRTLLKNGDYPYWKEAQMEEALDFSPDILVIKLGTNDSKPQNWQFREEFFSNYMELVQTFKEKMPPNGKVYICLPVPVFEDNWGITESAIVEEMTPMLKEIAKITGAKIINLHRPFRKDKDLFPDGIHPNKEGARKMASIIAKSIK